MAATDWLPEIQGTDQPKYIELADRIGADIASGRLKSGDRLPPQRKVAAALGVDVSLISRGYSEAARRGLLESHVGRGTFVSAPKAAEQGPDPRRTLEEDPRMNMPPEVDNPELIDRMRRGLDHVASNLVPLLRYQSALGSSKDREISICWLQSRGHQFSPSMLTIAPGAHAAIHAALSVMRQPETAILCESITYPGIRAIAAHLSLPLVGLEEDAKGITPASLERGLRERPDAVLYLNPTLRNPTTHTIPRDRRLEIAEVLRGTNTPLIEDDTYALIATDAPAPMAELIPDLTWHILGISKTFGAGLRLAYAVAPDREQLAAFVQILRTINVMTSPLNLALLSTWIEDGVADDIVTELVRSARSRQALAARVLEGCAFDAHPEAFNIWLKAPDGLSRAEILSRAFGGPLPLMPSDVFTVSGPPTERLRVCLGGPVSDSALEDGLSSLRSVLRKKEWSG